MQKSEEDNFIELAEEKKLYPARICRVKGNPNSAMKRSLLEFSSYRSEPTIKELIIETSRHQYTEEYIDLVKDFYLKL